MRPSLQRLSISFTAPFLALAIGTCLAACESEQAMPQPFPPQQAPAASLPTAGTTAVPGAVMSQGQAPTGAIPATPQTPAIPATPDVTNPLDPNTLPGTVAGAPKDLATPPALLSETGLFADVATETLGPQVRYYAPQYGLWTDGADKRRWVMLPEGAQIDTTEMDYWRYPVGTKLWKEFAKDGQVLEYRYMAKFGESEEDWVFMAYKWEPTMNDGIAVQDGDKNTAGTQHDIPSDLTCLKCHEGITDRALGFSALQLSHDGDGLTLSALTAEGRLSNPPAGNLVLPGDAVDQTALGYMHANCGHCHNPVGGEAYRKNGLVVMWQNADKLASPESTITLSTLMREEGLNLSLINQSIRRMSARPEGQMPSVGTEFVDDVGVQAVQAWLDKLTQQYPQDGMPDLSTAAPAMPTVP